MAEVDVDMLVERANRIALEMDEYAERYIPLGGAADAQYLEMRVAWEACVADLFAAGMSDDELVDRVMCPEF